jgi:hypothetical protein
LWVLIFGTWTSFDVGERIRLPAVPRESRFETSSPKSRA